MLRKGWSIESKYWNELAALSSKYKITWRRASYNRQSLMVIPEMPGIYMLCADVPNPYLRDSGLDGFSSPLYIGRTWQYGGLRARLKSHMMNPQDSVKDVYRLTTNIYILYSICNDGNEKIEQIEDKLITVFGPPANRIKASISGKLRAMEKVKILGD